MTNDNQLKDKLNDIKKDFKEDIEAKIQTIFGENISQKLLNEFKSNLQTAYDDLSASKYLFCCLGAVKAGKSTLINALCGKTVSIDSPAAETTKIPSVIRPTRDGEDEGIWFYGTTQIIPQNEKDSKLEPLVRKLMNYFLSDNEYKKDHCIDRSKRYPLNDGNLEKLTTGWDFAHDCPNAFIAEIRFKPTEGSFFIGQNNVAILDMPGLDGLKAGIKEKPEIKHIAKKCQHLILVQSSISAMNSTCLFAFKELKELHDRVNITVVLNKVEGINWFNSEAQENYFVTIKHKSSNEIKNAGIIPNHFVPVNCFKAKNSIENNSSKWERGINAEHLYKESNISELIDYMKKADHGDIKTHAMDSVANLSNSFEKFRSDIEPELNKKSTQLKKDLKNNGILGEVFKGKKEESRNTQLEMSNLRDDCFKKFFDKLEVKIVSCCQKYETEINGKSCACKRDAKKLAEELRNDFSKDDGLKIENYKNIFAECLAQGVYKYFSTKMDIEILKNKNPKDGLKNYHVLEKKINEFTDKINQKVKTPKKYINKELKGPAFLTGFFDIIPFIKETKYEQFKEKYKKAIRGYFDWLKKEIEKAAEDKKEITFDSVYQEIFPASGLNDIIEQCDVEFKDRMAEIEKVKTSLSDLKNRINELKGYID